MKIHVAAFSQSCRYGKYLSFATLVTPITVMGDEHFAFPFKVFFPCQTSTEEVLSMSRNQNWSLLRQNKSKSIWRFLNILDLQHVHTFQFNPQLRIGYRYHGIDYEHVNMLKIQNVWKASDGIVKNMLSPCQTNYEVWQGTNTQIVTPISNWPQQQQLPAGAVKKVEKISFEWKNVFFAFSHSNNFFGTYGHIQAIFNFLNLMLPALSHSQSPQHSNTHLQSLETRMETHFYIMAKSRKSFSLQLKRPTIFSFSGTKSCLKEKLWLQTTIFFRVVCLSVDLVPVIQKVFKSWSKN